MLKYLLKLLEQKSSFSVYSSIMEQNKALEEYGRQIIKKAGVSPGKILWFILALIIATGGLMGGIDTLHSVSVHGADRYNSTSHGVTALIVGFIFGAIALLLIKNKNTSKLSAKDTCTLPVTASCFVSVSDAYGQTVRDEVPTTITFDDQGLTINSTSALNVPYNSVNKASATTFSQTYALDLYLSDKTMVRISFFSAVEAARIIPLSSVLLMPLIYNVYRITKKTIRTDNNLVGVSGILATHGIPVQDLRSPTEQVVTALLRRYAYLWLPTVLVCAFLTIYVNSLFIIINFVGFFALLFYPVKIKPQQTASEDKLNKKEGVGA